MQHDEIVVFQLEDQLLGKPAQPGHAAASHLVDARGDGTQHERARETDALKAYAPDAPFQMLEIHGEVGKLGHGPPRRD